MVGVDVCAGRDTSGASVRRATNAGGGAQGVGGAGSVIDCSAQALVWVYFTDKSRALMKYSLRSAYEVTELVERLDSAHTEDRHAATHVSIDRARAVHTLSGRPVDYALPYAASS
jgi:hypothetical protein